ncbi:MAG: cytochrome c biogenesis CcdA family protein [Candidatus Nanopelagicales bacterium]
MNNLLTSGSILTAFLAGGIALFAPCCIVFLAPSYLAVAVKNRRWRLLPLTVIFAAGLASVLLPITLGMSLVSAAIAHYHRELYLAGGLLMLLLAAWSVTGRMWSLPSIIRAPDTRRGDSASFFTLGVFSGVASACCAPVLIGVMTLSALSANPVSGVALGLAYVFGMTFPLFVMALLWDRFELGKKRILRARPVRLPLPGGRQIFTNSINLAVAAALAVMGGFVLYLADSGQMTSGPRTQVIIGNWLGSIFRVINQALAPVPESILGLGILAIGAIFAYSMLRDRARDSRTPADEQRQSPAPEPHCH